MHYDSLCVIVLCAFTCHYMFLRCVYTYICHGVCTFDILDTRVYVYIYIRQSAEQASREKDVTKKAWLMLLLLLPKKKFSSFAWSSICSWVNTISRMCHITLYAWMLYVRISRLWTSHVTYHGAWAMYEQAAIAYLSVGLPPSTRMHIYWNTRTSGMSLWHTRSTRLQTRKHVLLPPLWISRRECCTSSMSVLCPQTCSSKRDLRSQLRQSHRAPAYAQQRSRQTRSSVTKYVHVRNITFAAPRKERGKFKWYWQIQQDARSWTWVSLKYQMWMWNKARCKPRLFFFSAADSYALFLFARRVLIPTILPLCHPLLLLLRKWDCEGVISSLLTAISTRSIHLTSLDVFEFDRFFWRVDLNPSKKKFTFSYETWGSIFRPFFKTGTKKCQVRFSYLLHHCNLCKGPRTLRKFLQKCQKIAGC